MYGMEDSHAVSQPGGHQERFYDGGTARRVVSIRAAAALLSALCSLPPVPVDSSSRAAALLCLVSPRVSSPLSPSVLSQWETRSLTPVMARQLLSAAKDEDGRLSVNNTALQQVRGRAEQAASILPRCRAPLC